MSGLSLRRVGPLSSLVALLAVLSNTSMLAAQTGGDANPHGILPSGIDCDNCHNPDGWTPLRAHVAFDHNRQTHFRLDGKHLQSPCSSCHLDLRFDEPRASVTECESCHVDVHQGHMASPCITCHTTASFTEITGLTIHAATSFPLDGAHMQLSCESCHVNDRGGAFTTLDTQCISCHQADYNGAASINHQDARFPETCEQCHNSLAWAGGTLFDHVVASNGFNLVGAHQDARCQSCHVMPARTLIFNPSSDTDCLACHQNEYNQEHAGSGFPTECLACHDQVDWRGATFADHDAQFFPIFSGPHRGKWQNDCATCHNVPNSFQTSTCFSCHEHAQSQMDDKHREVSGYAYETTACLSCHPDGRSR